ncbi:hypothetical protein JSO54_09575 [Riemerella anatipestifer]|uniref:hypothetical protein n=1 Tax=Riemerella anatipestifer TaxID=34085 RepID=UPI0030BE83C4
MLFLNLSIEKPEILVAILALIVSIIGVFISIWTIKSTQKHNKLSVKPIIYILPQDYEDKICVNIQNKGTGPLIVKKIIFYDNELKKNSKSLVDLMPELEYYYWSNFSNAENFVLSPGETKILLELTGDLSDRVFTYNRDLVRKKLSKINIQIEYTGIYEDENLNIIYDLKWYDRN